MHKRLSDTIWEYLLQPFKLPEGFKPSQARLPTDKGIETYRGSLRFSHLKNFLLTLCIDLALKDLGERDKNTDWLQLLILPSHLIEEAKWIIICHVININCTKYDWTFEKAILTLYNHFVLPTSMYKVQEELKQVCYNSCVGIQGYFDDIMDMHSAWLCTLTTIPS